jgi:hypothetical protein
MTDDPLVAFLRARLDEDEQVARDAGAEAWRKAERPSIWVTRADGPVAQTKDFEDAAHIARHDPARVLRDVEAKRRIIDLHAPRHADDYERWGTSDCVACYDLTPCRTVRLLALPYADHPDYREHWRL